MNNLYKIKIKSQRGEHLEIFVLANTLVEVYNFVTIRYDLPMVVGISVKKLASAMAIVTIPENNKHEE